ncbi:MAG: FAD-binding protein [Gammaproteobacteria bacterium]
MKQPLRSWGNHPATAQTGQPVHWRDEVPAVLAAVARVHGDTLAYGNGRSYGDSCIAASEHALQLRGLDRFIAFDREQGILRAEAGVTLGEILALAIPHGWFLPVTPGTQFVTLGGAIANDVHGKNHHRRGTFGRHVRQFGLLRSGETGHTCSPATNSELFAATIGGLGLTGIITWAEVALMPVRSSQVDTLTVRFDSLAEFFALSAELDPQHEYSVAWIDCLADGSRAGRGAFSAGDHAVDGPLSVAGTSALRLPFTPPFSLVNAATLRAFNTAYWHLQPARRRARRRDYAPFFYPLDGIRDWNRGYGPGGFQQYQCVIPEAAAADAIGELLAAIAASGRGSFLAVLKRCGDLQSPGLLSFPLAGTSLALDFPQHDDLDRRLFPRLDAIVRSAGGRLYPAKDAHMRGEDFRRAYPAWEQLAALRDPALNSRFWQRVTS